MKKIIVLNLGSTSFKFKLFDFSKGESVLAVGEVENIGSPNCFYRVVLDSTVVTGEFHCVSHSDAFDLCINILNQYDVLVSLDNLDAIGYKAVHGGAVRGVQLVNDSLLSVMESFASFAPAHNPIYCQMMRQLQVRYPKLCQVAYFETSFHASIPAYRVAYGIPYEWQEQYGIRRYGFHGSSHGYIAQKLKEIEPSAKKVISIHLGGSSSLCAISNGKSIATSMGATPQSGVFHNNRIGDFDVFCLPKLVEKYQGDLNLVMNQLSTKGGFLGLSGISNDLRIVLKERDAGNEQADLAVKAFVDNIVGYIGMLMAHLNGLDALVFTGKIGKRSAIIRSMVCECLGFLSVKLDDEKNQSSCEGKISSFCSKVGVWILETNEELMVARQTSDYLLKKEMCELEKDYIIEARIEEEFMNSTNLIGRIHSKFQSVLNILFDIPEDPGRLITILPPGYTGIPDSFVISKEYFSKIALLPIGAKVVKDGFTFSFPCIPEQLVGTSDCRRTSKAGYYCIGAGKKIIGQNQIDTFQNAIDKFISDSGRGNGFSLLSETRKEQVVVLLRSYCKALLEGDKETIISVFPRCVGIGKGLTPSTDDAMVGIMAIVTAVKIFVSQTKTCRIGKTTKQNCLILSNMKMYLMELINGKTTDISLKYLLNALESRFSDVLLDLVYLIFTDYSPEWKPKIEAVARIGGSSGMDMLFGIVIGCQKIKEFLYYS